MTDTPIEALPIPTEDPLSGEAYSAQQQLEMLGRNREWLAKFTSGDPMATAQKRRLDMAVLAERGEAADGSGDGQGNTERTPPEAFRFNYEGGAPQDADERALDGDVRAWLSAAGFDAERGTGFGGLVDRLMGSREWTDEAVEEHVERGRAVLRGAWGEAFAGNVALLERLIGDVEAERPGLGEFLMAYPMVITDPVIAQQLLHVAELRYGK